LKYALVALVCDSIPQWHIDRISLSSSDTVIPHFAGPWEKLSVLVKAGGHDSIRRVKRLLDPVSMVDVNVNVEHSLVIP
jgi:hypothetical protein